MLFESLLAARLPRLMRVSPATAVSEPTRVQIISEEGDIGEPSSGACGLQPAVLVMTRTLCHTGTSETPAVALPPTEMLELEQHAMQEEPAMQEVVPASEEATGMVGASDDDNSAALEDFISKVTMSIPPSLVDKPPCRH